MGSETLPLNEMGIFPLTDPDLTQCVTYACNLAFSDVLDACKNAKFPGGLAVSLSRELLPRLHGHRGHHLPYEAPDILAWIHPVERVIPPMQLGQAAEGTRKSTLPRTQGGNHHHHPGTGRVATSSSWDVLQLDFGSAAGCFDVLPVVCVCPSNLDFGSADGLFRIV